MQYSTPFLLVHGKFTMPWEGGGKFHIVKGDPGGATKYGVSFRFLRNLPLEVGDINKDGKLTWHDIKALDKQTSMEIFYRYFWLRGSCHKINDISAMALYDTAVNCGTTRAVRFLQMSVGSVPDGIFGPKTLSAYQRTVAKESEAYLTTAIIDQRQWYYDDLAAEKRWAKKFINGWTNRTNALRVFVREARVEIDCNRAA